MNVVYSGLAVVDGESWVALRFLQVPVRQPESDFQGQHLQVQLLLGHSSYPLQLNALVAAVEQPSAAAAVEVQPFLADPFGSLPQVSAEEAYQDHSTAAVASPEVEVLLAAPVATGLEGAETEFLSAAACLL